MKTLTVIREWYGSYSQKTILKDCKGSVKAIINSSLQQPRYGQKTIVINCWTYLLDWTNVELAKRRKHAKNK